MRKLLLVALMAVSACAWADVEIPTIPETYNYSLAVNSFKFDSVKGLPTDTVLKLVDVTSGDVLVQMGVNDLSSSQSPATSVVSANNRETADFAASWSIGPDKMTGTGYYLTLNMTGMKFDSGTYSTYIDPSVAGNAHSDGSHTWSDKLQVVFSSASANLSQTADIELSSNGSSLSSGIIFSPGPVPEPTSAMLLLLGVTGLMLKRKRA